MISQEEEVVTNLAELDLMADDFESNAPYMTTEQFMQLEILAKRLLIVAEFKHG